MSAAKKAAAKPEPKQAPEVPEKVEAQEAPEREPDRVAMLSVRADGTPDQFEPEVIG